MATENIKEKVAYTHEMRDRWMSRMECPGCGRMMIPRVISYYGAAANTVCPFCVKVIWRAPKDKVTAFVEKALIAGFILIVMIFVVFNLIFFY